LNKAILSEEVQQYLWENENTEISRFILSGSPFKAVTAAELAQQLEGRKKAKQKLPFWYEHRGIYYPPKLNIEQTSSQATARYKADLIGKEKLLIDITGGVGIDAYFFSLQHQEIIHCEINDEISQIAAHNFKILEARHIKTVTGDGIAYLENSQTHFDTIYVDPSRRNESKGKVFMLKDCLPNIPEKIGLLLSKSSQILVKTSPLLDISAGLSELSNVAEIHIVAVNNEVKELLWLLKNGAKKTDFTLKTANILADKIDFTTVNYQDAIKSTANFAPVKKFLFEPNAALLKSGLFNWIGKAYGLDKLHPNTHLYTSNIITDFPGRVFKVLEVMPFNKKIILKKWSGKKANITTRNFKIPVESLRKKFKIKDGGETYLFFCTDIDNSPIVVVCKKA